MNQNEQDPNNNKEPKINEKRLVSVGYKLGFMLHDNFSIHVVYTLIINLLSSAAVIGIFSAFSPVVKVDNIWTFLIAMIFYSLMELMIKILVIRFFFKMIIQSFGLPFYIINLVLFFLTTLLVPEFSFLTDPQNIFIFTLGLMVLRLLLSTYTRKSRLFQKGV